MARYAISPGIATGCVISAIPRIGRNAEFSATLRRIRATNVRPTSVTYRQDNSRGPWPGHEARAPTVISLLPGTLSVRRNRLTSQIERLMLMVPLLSQPMGCARLVHRFPCCAIGAEILSIGGCPPRPHPHVHARPYRALRVRSGWDAARGGHENTTFPRSHGLGRGRP